LERVLIGSGHLTREKLRKVRENMEKRGPENGAQLVARAWTDDAYRARLLADGNAAAAEEGFDVKEAQLIVLENSDSVHNVIVCTLCSCYPRSLLGQPPDWYVSKAYRARTIREPRKVLQEFGLKLDEATAIHVHDSNADMRYMVLPQRPDGTENMSNSELAGLITRDHLIGVAVPSASD
jgi:nitrile hydratase